MITIRIPVLAFEGNKTRRIIVRIEYGERLVPTLLQIARERSIGAAWVSGNGIADTVSVATYEINTRGRTEARHISGPADLSAINGSISLQDGSPIIDLRGVVAKNGASEFVGMILDAELLWGELFIEVFDDVSLDREHDPQTGMHLWKKSERRMVPAPRYESRDEDAFSRSRNEPERSRSDAWTRASSGSGRSVPITAELRAELRSSAPKPIGSPVAQALPEKKKTNDEELLSEPIPENGDWLAHKQFGLCQVEGEDDDGATLVRIPSGVRKSIRLDIFRVMPARFEDGRKIYELEPRRK